MLPRAAICLALSSALALCGAPADELAAWLAELNLGQFGSALRELGVAEPSDLALLDAGDLDSLGLKKIHRLKLQKAIGELGEWVPPPLASPPEQRPRCRPRLRLS